MSGRVCERHYEYAADGVCRWCEPAVAPTPTAKAADDVCVWPAGFEHVDYMGCTDEKSGCVDKAVIGCKLCGVARCAASHAPPKHMPNCPCAVKP